MTRIRKEPSDGGAVSTLLEVPRDHVYSYALSADGTQLVYSRGPVNSDIVLKTDQR